MDPLPPDPYQALGLPKDVDTDTIKKTYKKLVLKCHPDKVTDESLKAQKAEEFHRIQQAYELIGEEESRSRYDAEVRLESLRREKAARGASGGGPDVRTAHYNMRTQAPAGATFQATGPPRYEEHKPARYPDDRDRFYEERSRSSKYADTYEAYPPKTTPSRSSREKVSPQKAPREPEKARPDYERSKKSRDKERDRDRRHVTSERERDSDPSGDEKARYEAEYKRRSEDARTREAAADLRRKAEDRREYDREKKTRDLAHDAVRYISASAKLERPSPSRTNSSRDVRDYYEVREKGDRRDDRSRRDRPDVVRRSSARPRERERHSPSRKGPEIVDWEDDRKMPAFKHSSSSPAEIHVPRTTPHRSYTESSHHRRESPPPMFRRSETMPSVPQTSTSRKSSAVPRPSGLRESVTPHDSGSSSPEAYTPIPSASSTKRYYYPTTSGGVSLTPEDVGVANGHRTILREPERHRRSPSPLTRPPMGANRPSEGSVRYTTAAPSKSSVPPPPLGRSATMNVAEDRGRSRPLYGEVGIESSRRENARRQTSFSPDKVSYSRKIGPEDVSWAPRSSGGRDKDREYAKPQLGRHATYVF